MTKEELVAFYEKLSALTDSGTEGDVRAYINQEYPRLPEDVRNELLFNTLLTSVKDEAREEASIADIQQKGLAAAESLENTKVQIEKEGLTE